MKRGFLIFFSFVLLFFCACSDERATENSLTSDSATLPSGTLSASSADPMLEVYLNSIKESVPPVHRFGKAASYIEMDEEISVVFLYPETEIAPLDDALYAWIKETVSACRAEKNESDTGGETAELTVTYTSDCIGDGVVTVKMSGTFASPHLAHPEDIVKTFLAHQKENRLLSLSDIINEDSLIDFEDLLIEKAGIDVIDVDSHLLDLVSLTQEGIEVTVKRGMYLPSSEGTKTFFFPYDELKDLLRDDFNFAPGDHKDSETENLPEAQEPPAEMVIDPEKPMLALTFDDGPGLHTQRLLEIFGKYGGKGTFFVMGNFIDARKSVLLQIDAMGHEIGNHSWSHRQFTNLDQKGITDQIMMTRAKIYEVTGKDCLLVRPPYGACDAKVKKVGAELGVYYIHWSVDSLDWKTKNPQAIYDEVMKFAKDGAIILCHDLHKTTVDAMELVIPKLLEEGYQLVTVSELLSHSDRTLTPGEVYYKK